VCVPNNMSDKYDDLSTPADHSDIAEQTTGKDANSARYKISVLNPQKSGGKNAYVAYEVNAEALSGSKEKLISVRRFSDFLWLHDQLASHNRSLVIPPMPEKSLTGNFSPELLLFRCRELTRFLMRISIHPTLSKDEHFEFFLTADKDAMSRRRDEVEEAPKSESSSSGGKTSWFSSFMKRANDAKLAVMGSDEDDNPYFKETEELLKSKNALLNQMLSNSTALVERWNRMSLNYLQQAELIRSFSRLSTGKEDKATLMFNDDASGCDECVKLASEFATKLEHSYHDSIRDYLRENEAIQAVIDERRRLLRNYNSLAAQAAKGSIPLDKKDAALAELDRFSKVAQEDIQRVMTLREFEIDCLAQSIARSHRSVFKQLNEVWALAYSTLTA